MNYFARGYVFTAFQRRCAEIYAKPGKFLRLFEAADFAYNVRGLKSIQHGRPDNGRIYMKITLRFTSERDLMREIAREFYKTGQPSEIPSDEFGRGTREQH